MKSVARFLKDESGATAIEYALIAGLIFVVIVGSVTATGNAVKVPFENVSDTLL